jgi:fluoroacetyl-CoA thioesterase
MKDTLEEGITGEDRNTVTKDMSPGHLPQVVLSTPAMVGLIEKACFETAQRHLDEGETTVGTHICVSHVAAALEGQEVTVHCRLAKREKRRLTFDIQVSGPDGQLSSGTHERAVIRIAPAQ